MNRPTCIAGSIGREVFATQIGGRHRYAIPEALCRHGLLSRFLTELAISESSFRIGQRFVPAKLQKQLKSRVISDALSKITSSSPRLLKHLGFNRSHSKSIATWDRTLVDEVERTCPKNATVVVGLFLEAIAAFEHFKERGLQTVMEVYIAPHSALIVRDENRKFPEIADLRYDAMCGTAIETWNRAIAATDHYIAPSDFVVEGLRYFGADTKSVRIVPYGVPNEFFQVRNDPTPKRVLFVGTADIRKGVHYFAQAASELHHRGFEFHVIGGATETVQKLLRESHVVYHGRIPREDTLAEYAKADLFALPSLAEGSATVAYEAMAAGVPVITTPNAGSVILHEHDGIIVPICDLAELTKQIVRVAEDRTLRDRLAGEAKETSMRYRLDNYGDRFVEALVDLTGLQYEPNTFSI